MKPAGIYYPWLSTLGALTFVVWQFVLNNRELVPLERLALQLPGQDNFLTAAGLLVALVMFDIWRFAKASRRYRTQLGQYQEQISELFDSRRELGTRAHLFRSCRQTQDVYQRAFAGNHRVR